MNKLLLMIAILSGIVCAQVSADLKIENQQVVGTDFLFDIYLTRTNTNDVYLGNGDMVLTFNSGAFNNPTFSKETFSFWNLTSTLGTSVGSAYWAAMGAAAIVGNELIVNMNLIGFGETQEGFEIFVAKIDDSPSTHRLGRFKVSNINNPSEFMNLQWKTTGTGVLTNLATYQPVFPWTLSSITLNAIDPPPAPLPVELTSFIAKVSGDVVQLNWETKTEINNYGFDIERASSPTSPLQGWTMIGFVEGNGNSSSPKEYSYFDKNVQSGNYTYRLKQIDTDGQFEYSSEVNVVVEVPADYAFQQNFPNPFNPSTTIKFSIPENGMVKLTVYDLLGQEVRTLVEEQRQAGTYNEKFDAVELNSGIYFYELRVNGFVQTKKMQVLK